MSQNSTTVESAPTPVDENPWISHVRAYHKATGGIWKDALKGAGATYKPVPKKAKVLPEDRKENPWMKHIEEFKKRCPNWKDDLTYKQLLVLCKSTYVRADAPVKTE
jgi:hypothetical protein